MNSRRDFVRCIAGGSLLSLALGKVPASILLSPEASLSEKWAAEQLSVHLGQMTGVRLPVIISEKPSESPAILVGRSAAVDKYRLDIPEGEACLLKTVGENLIIAGGRQRGTMYGVFCFLEKMGCRWYTADIARIPQIRTLSMPRINEIIHPAFEYREVFFTEAQGKEWSARNRLNGHFHQLDETVGGKISYMPFAHSFYELIPPGQYFETHPEYFALVSGKRRRENAQLCLTNADVVRIAIDRVQKWMTEHQDVSIVSVSQNDNAGWCECDPCRQVVRNEGGAVSGLLLHFVNQIARAHPGTRIDTLAYQETADPPTMVKPLRNVQIRLCPIDACQAHSYQTCIYNSPFKEQLSQWARITPNLVAWQYSINFSHFLLPFPNEPGLISDIQQFKRAGISGVFVEGAVSDGGGGENAELRAYLAARLLWNPEVDVNAEIHGFLNAVYGPAAPLMWRYLVLRQREIGPGEHLWIDQNVDAPYLTNRYLKGGRDLLNRALLKAENGPVRRRIERSLLSFDYVEAMRARRCSFQRGFYGPGELGRSRQGTEAFIRKAGSLGITHLREGYPLVDQARDLDELGRAYPVVALDDGMLAVKIVPDLGARVVALGPSGSAENVLRAPDPGEWAYPNAGGLYFSLGERVNWRSGPATQRAVTLSGQSDKGLDLEMEISLDSGALRMRITVANRTPSPLPVVLHCQAELAFGPLSKAVLKYTARSGPEVTRRIEPSKDGNVLLTGDDFPRQEWSVLQLQNRFRAEEVAKCGIRWSFRGTPGLSMSLWSPEVLLASGQEISMESQYRLA
ncbi:MAG: DUF4838 domain-containing protein [Bryobacteraceae bacterium]|jgi:hypothetical protein